MSDFDPFAERFIGDPYAVYRELRDRPAATWSELDQGWLITRFDDVSAVLRDPESFSSDDRRALRPRDRSRPTRRRNMLGTDPPEHTRLRRAVATRWKPPFIPTRPTIEAVVDGLLDAGLRRGQIELMEQLAVPLPLLLTAQMLGLPREEWRRLRLWSDSEMAEIHASTSPEEAVRLRQVSAEMHAHFRAAIENARVLGGEGTTLFAELRAAADEEGRLGSEELLELLALLVRAGSHTVTHLIGNGVLALLRQRETLEALRVRPELWPAAIDELLRLVGPVQTLARVATRKATLHGVALAPGERVQVVLASANRDERRFTDPDALRLDRDGREHVALGDGVHHCLGAQLGRLEVQVALERLLARMPLIARAELLRDPDWGWTWGLRGLRRLLLRGGD